MMTFTACLKVSFWVGSGPAGVGASGSGVPAGGWPGFAGTLASLAPTLGITLFTLFHILVEVRQKSVNQKGEKSTILKGGRTLDPSVIV